MMTDDEIVAFRAKAKSDPSYAVAYKAKDCHELARLGSIGRTRPVLVSLADIQAVLQRTGTWWAMTPILSQPTHPAYSDVVVVMDVSHAIYANLDMTLPLTSQIFTNLVAHGVMPQTVLDQITAMDAAPDPITQYEAAVALYAPNGDEL